ncbi:MAG TPA: class I SAM-dependent methyltransferase [Polyangia bacterium]|nr:class I SAM-dependent methyltransferase [Polyangia bacterium]
MSAPPDFDWLERCFACGASGLQPVGAYHFLPWQGGFVPDAWLAWCHDTALLIRCGRCGSQGPFRRPSEALLSSWYAQQSYAAGDVISEGHRRATERLRSIGKATLVDIGCGGGTFLDLLPPDIQGFGLEPSLKSAAFGRARGRRIFAPDAEGWSADLPDAVDVIALFDVIEHLRTPGPFVRRLLRRLNPGGRLVIFTGDAGSAWSRRWGIRWWYHGWAGHLSCFSATGLGTLLQGMNLSRESIDSLVYMHDTPTLRRRVRELPLRLANRIGALRLLDAVRPPYASSPYSVDHMLMVARAPA